MSNSRYWAFISYSHADEAAATKLHRALERYTLPASVRRAHGLPKRLIPVFRDVEELEAAAGLTTRLQGALDESRWLIVLCSKNSATSKYVNAEIEYFVKKRGAQQVLCVLLDEAPPACFPPAIREFKEEPLAADMRAGADFELAVLRLIAAISLIGFTDLRNRETQRKRRIQWSAAAAVAIAGLGGVAYWDFYHREFVEYYAHYVRRYGTWTGIDALSPDAAKRRHEVYRFTRNGRLNPPAFVDFVEGITDKCPRSGMNPLIKPREPRDPYGDLKVFCQAQFQYTQGGFVRQEYEMGTDPDRGHPVTVELLQIEAGPDGALIMSMGSKPQSVTAKHDTNGFDLRIHDFDLQRGYEYAYDHDGRVVRRSAIFNDKSGPKVDWGWKETGEVSMTTYSPDGLPIEIRNVDLKGQLRLGSEGFSVAKLAYDGDGNVSSTTFFDAAGKPVELAVKPILARFYGQ